MSDINRINELVGTKEFEEAMNQIRNIIVPQPPVKQEIQENPILQF